MSDRAPSHNRFMPLGDSGRISPDPDDKFDGLKELAEAAERDAFSSRLAALGQSIQEGPGLSTTTRAELSASSAASSHDPQELAPLLSPFNASPVRIGTVRAREDTPSAALLHAERRGQVNQTNNETARGQHVKAVKPSFVFGTARHVESLDFGQRASSFSAHSLAGPSLAGPSRAGRRKSFPANGRRSPTPTDTILPGFEFTAGVAIPSHQARRLEQSPKARILVPDSQTMEAIPPTQASQPSQAPQASRPTASSRPRPSKPKGSFVPKTEPDGVFYQRQQVSQDPVRANFTREMAPSPSPRDHRGENRMLVPDLPSQNAPPAGHAQYADAVPAAAEQQVDELADDDMDDDDADYEVPAAQPPQAVPSSPPAPPHPAFEPRNEGAPSVPPMATDRERAQMRAIAPELEHSTVFVRATGAPRPREGAVANEIRLGLTDKHVEYHAGQPGPKCLAEVQVMFDRLASTFTIPDIVGMLNLISDRMFLVAFPNNRVTWAPLYTPKNHKSSVKIRAGVFISSGMSERMVEIWVTCRFLFMAGLQILSYSWVEPGSTYIFCFIGLLTDDEEFVLKIIIEAFIASIRIRNVVKRQYMLDHAGAKDEVVKRHVDSVVEKLANKISVESTMIVPKGGATHARQFSVFIDTKDLILDSEYSAFKSAVHDLEIEHPSCGYAVPQDEWDCDVCSAENHPYGKCDSKVILNFKSPRELAAAQSGPSRQRGPFPAAPFNSGRNNGRR